MTSSAKRQEKDESRGGPDFTGTTIAVLVNDEIFQVHQKLASATSDFFINAANPIAIDVERKPIVVHGYTAATFRIYLTWLYTKQMGHVTERKHVWQTLVEAFLIGITLLDTTFRNAVMACMTQRVRAGRYPSYTMMKGIYAGTCEGAPIRNLLVDICVVARPTVLNKMRNPAAEMHKDFVNDLLRAFFKQTLPRIADGEPWVTDPHRYLEIVD